MRTRICPFQLRTYSVRALALAVVLLVWAEPSLAQVTASISGVVHDVSGGALPGVTVTARSLETGFTRTVVTDEAGRYRALSLAVGPYEVRAELAGFKTDIRSGINLTIGQDALVNLVLAIGEIAEQVVVSGDAPLINATTTQTAGLVGAYEIKSLPLNGRGFDNLITLNPGTVNFSQSEGGNGLSGSGNRFAVAGRRYTENMYLFDGIERQGVSRSSSTMPGGASGEMLGIDAVREFNVVKDTYPAEYGKVAGGQVSIVTMSGTNEFHGTAFEFLRHDALDARNFFDKGSEPPPFRRYNFGFSGGGPLRRNGTFIFGNYEGFRERLGLSNLAIVPDENARRGLLPDSNNAGQLIDVGVAPSVIPYLELWPLPNGRNLGDGTAEMFSNPERVRREDFFTVRLDHNFSDRDSLAVTYTFDDGNATTPAPNPRSETFFENRQWVWSIGETHIFSPNLLSTLRVGVSRGSYFFDARPAIDMPAELSFVQGQPIGGLNVGGVTVAGSHGATTNARGVRTLYTVDEQIQLARGRHLFKVGVWLQKLTTAEVPTPSQYGSFDFSSLQLFLEGRPSRFLVVPNTAGVHFRQLAGAWFIQDRLTLGNALTVNVGLRHEFTDGWNERDGRSSNFFPGPDGVLPTEPMVGNSPFTENRAKWLLGPRVSVAWAPTESGKTAIHAAYGVHYSLLTNLAFLIEPNPPYSTRFQVSNPPFPVHVVPNEPLDMPAARPAPSGMLGDLETPRVQAWTLALEQEVLPSLALRVAYVGSHGSNQLVNSDLNTVVPVIQADGTKFFPPGAGRANPQLGNSKIARSASDSEYHALELSARRRMSDGLQLRAAYTWAHALDISSQLIFADASGSNQHPLDPADLGRDYASSSFDVRQRFSFSATYELPVGQGRRFWAGAGALPQALFGGWQANFIVNLQTGLPFTPEVGFNRSRNGDTRNPDRPDLADDFTSYDDVIVGRPDAWFDPTAFVLPAAGTYGDVGRNVLRGPGLATVDLSLVKTAAVGSRLRMEVRGEVFNLLNRANFDLPGRQIFNPNGTIRASAGVITSTSTSSRQAQLGLKLIW